MDDPLSQPSRFHVKHIAGIERFRGVGGRGCEFSALRAVAVAGTIAAARRRCRRAIARRRTALRLSESRFRRLVESNLIGVSFSTLDGRVLDGNDEYFRIIGRRRDEARRETFAGTTSPSRGGRSATAPPSPSFRPTVFAGRFRRNTSAPTALTCRCSSASSCWKDRQQKPSEWCSISPLRSRPSARLCSPRKTPRPRAG